MIMNENHCANSHGTGESFQPPCTAQPILTQNRMKKFPILVLVALLSGCAGTYFNDKNLAKLHVGMTKAEAREAMGSPHTRVTYADGTEKWVATRSHRR